MKDLYLKMMLVFAGSVCVHAQSSHEACLSYGCFELSDTQLAVTADGAEIFHSDFKRGELVWDDESPIRDISNLDYTYSLYRQTQCKTNVYQWKSDKSAKEKPKEAPEVILYPRDEVVNEEDNTLICFVNHFFPPSVNIMWTKNNVEVSEENAFSRCLPNPDGTFYVFSQLSFVPKEGDIYSCTVEHEALKMPRTRFWEVEVDEIGVGPSVVCGLGLSLGLLGVGAGTFFFMKGSQYHGVTDPCL